MTFKNGKHFKMLTMQPVDNAIAPVDKLPYVEIAYFRHRSSAVRIVGQQCFSVVNDGIHKPDSALRTITCNEFLYGRQIFTSLP